MRQFLKILDVRHLDNNGDILWQQKNISNIFHATGEEFLLKILFNTAAGLSVPSTYYLGLDARATLSVADELSNLSQEPTQFGYARQAVSSINGFTVSLSGSSYRATSQVVSFGATGGSWGPVKNIFLATVSSGTSGYLISSVALNNSRTVNSGQAITMRFAVSLTNC